MTDIEKLRAMIASHHRIVFFGGAGGLHGVEHS